MPNRPVLSTAFALLLAGGVDAAAAAEPSRSVAAPAAPRFDADAAQRYGADARGMRRYVLVILKTGATRVPDGPARDAMFAGHFANIERLAKAGKLAVAGPFMQDPSGWRGLYVFAVDSIDEAKALTGSDPVIVRGEMVAEYHPWYGSAALMATPALHETLVPPSTPAG